MKKYVISWSKDATEWGLTSWQNWIKSPVLRSDTEGRPMNVRVVWAADIEGAKVQFEQLRDETRKGGTP